MIVILLVGQFTFSTLVARATVRRIIIIIIVIMFECRWRSSACYQNNKQVYPTVPCSCIIVITIVIVMIGGRACEKLNIHELVCVYVQRDAFGVLRMYVWRMTFCYSVAMCDLLQSPGSVWSMYAPINMKISHTYCSMVPKKVLSCHFARSFHVLQSEKQHKPVAARWKALHLPSHIICCMRARARKPRRDPMRVIILVWSERDQVIA